MTVYVDEPIHPFGNMLMCHMWSADLDELLAMVDLIGVQRRWLQQPPKASWVHFDISKGKRLLAIRHGAVATDRYGPVEHCCRLDLVMGDPERVRRAHEKLAHIAHIRARHVVERSGQADLFA